jgi:acetyl-CoA carboxylase carboxyl transferase subunit beta
MPLCSAAASLAWAGPDAVRTIPQMAWWSRPKGLQADFEDKKSVPRGIATKCEGCGEILLERDLLENLRVCKFCGYHLRISTQARMKLVLDEGSFAEADTGLRSVDPLEFRVDGKRYRDQLRKSEAAAGAGDAYRSGSGAIGGYPVEVGFFAFEFMGGSMGAVVGEKIARQFERAIETRHPAVVFSASGGARMQEGVLSLMQMAKTAVARSRMREENVPYISVLLHPTTGGVAASFALLGDIIIAEPNALIGFAGPRVIEQTIRQKLPEGFQRSEFLLEHGMIDLITTRAELKATLERVLAWFGRRNGALAAPDKRRPGTAGAGSRRS